MAFRNSLLLIAFFLVATTSVANCTILPVNPGLGIPNPLQTIIIAPTRLLNITAGVGVLTPFVGANVTLICNGVLIPTTVVSRNGTIVITVTIPNAAQINPSCIVSANVSIGGVTNTVTSTLSSLAGLVSSVVSLVGNLFLADLIAVFVNGTFINLAV
ncbi:hypothetical protein TIFTF001_048899 [Ficus carica]|uniref:Uncharacterized protein n=1 Tax=Ficus carica TaxID=3494 RepID=A0AA87YTF0_FICCA|nr:hypothetical protein TIFTF001_048899 [Ficus carica]